MTVTDIVLNFRRALVAVVPAAEHVRMPWRRPDAYDEWDAIASALYDGLVTEVLRWALPERSRSTFKLAQYDLLLPSYAGLSTLRVIHPSLPDGFHVFHALGTRESPFDVVEVRSVLVPGGPSDQGLEMCPLDGTTFHLHLDTDKIGNMVIEELDIGR